MKELIQGLADYCDGVSGSEHLSDLIRMSTAIQHAQFCLWNTMDGKRCRENGRIAQALLHEKNADSAVAELHKLTRDIPGFSETAHYRPE